MTQKVNLRYLPMKRPISMTLCFAVASYAVLVTGTALACAVWLPAFELPAGTPSFRPMGETVRWVLIGAGTTALSLGFAIATAASNPRRVWVWVLAVCLTVLSLAPIPVSRRFLDWVLVTHGLELAP
jgi:hypothetical protein